MGTPSATPAVLSIQCLEDIEDSWQVCVTTSTDANGGSHRSVQLSKDWLLENPVEADIHWYFSTRVSMPLLENSRAEGVSSSLKSYGRALLRYLVDSPAIALLESVLHKRSQVLNIFVIGPRSFQCLKWEAMRLSEQAVPLCVQAGLIRQTDNPVLRHQQRLLTVNRINVLIVCARTRGRSDIGYRTITQVIVDILQRDSTHFYVKILRPGTRAALENELSCRGAGFYHIVHFDMHGLVIDGQQYQEYLASPDCACSQPIVLEGSKEESFLEFMGQRKLSPLSATTGIDLMDAATLKVLLSLYRPWMCVFNACDSASARASLTHSAYEAGIPHVVGMNHALTETAATMMMKTFYLKLVEGAPFSECLQSMRRQVWLSKTRTVFYDVEIELEDWYLPVAYSQGSETSFRLERSGLKSDLSSDIHCVTSDQDNTTMVPHTQTLDFFGRDADIMDIENSLLDHRNSMLIRGLTGIGKSMLLQHLCSWWCDTDFCAKAFYYEFRTQVWSFEGFVKGLLQQECLNKGVQQEHDMKQKLEAIVKAFDSNRYVLVLDNVESITGEIDGKTAWDQAQRRDFRRFLMQLAKTTSFILLGSRAAEQWLSVKTFEDNIIFLQGLDPAAISQLIARSLKAIGYKVKKESTDLQDLDEISKLLDRHPLAVQMLIGTTRSKDPSQILSDLRGACWDLSSDEALLTCVQSTYEKFTQSTKIQIDYLHSLGTHLIIEDLDRYAKELLSLEAQTDIQPKYSVQHVDWFSVFQELEVCGLAAHVRSKPNQIVLHPILPRFLHQHWRSQLADHFDQFMNVTKTALRFAVRGLLYDLYHSWDVQNPWQKVQQLNSRMSFASEMYRYALEAEIVEVNEGRLDEIPVVWNAFCIFYERTMNFEEWIRLAKSMYPLIATTTPSAKLFACEVLGNMAYCYKAMQDRQAALNALRDQLNILDLIPVRLQTRRTTSGEPIVGQPQRVVLEHRRIVLSKSKALEDLATLLIIKGRPRLGQKCVLVALAWRRCAMQDSLVLRGFEYESLHQALIVSEAANDYEHARRYSCGALIRAIEMKRWYEVVRLVILKPGIDCLAQEELEIADMLLKHTVTYLVHIQSLNDIPAVQLFRVGMMSRLGRHADMLAVARQVLAISKQNRDTHAEQRLHIKLAQIYEEQKDLAEARESWQKALSCMPQNEDLGELATQEQCLEGIARAESGLGINKHVQENQMVLGIQDTVLLSLNTHATSSGETLQRKTVSQSSETATNDVACQESSTNNAVPQSSLEVQAERLSLSSTNVSSDKDSQNFLAQVELRIDKEYKHLEPTIIYLHALLDDDVAHCEKLLSKKIALFYRICKQMEEDMTT